MEENNIIIPEEAPLSQTELAQTVGVLIEQMMSPILQGMVTMIQQNTKAMEAIAEQQAAQSRKMDELERQLRFAVPVSSTQVRYINSAIRERARELLDKFDVRGKEDIARLGRIIRKSVLSRYGCGSVSEIPKCEYMSAIKAAETWMDTFQVRDVVRGAGEHA